MISKYYKIVHADGEVTCIAIEKADQKTFDTLLGVIRDKVGDDAVEITKEEYDKIQAQQDLE